MKAPSLKILYKKYIQPAVGKIQAQFGYVPKGSYGYMMSGAEKFPDGLSNTSFVIDHTKTRRQARIACKESLQANAVINRMADTVADSGLRLEALPMVGIIGITPREAEIWGRNVDERFDLFSKDKNQNRSANITFYQSHHLYQKFQHRDNDIFVRLYYSKERDLQNPLQFEFIDPDQVRGDAFTFSNGIQITKDGITRGSKGREKSYSIWIYDNKGHVHSVEIPRIGSKSKKVMMIHGFMAEYAGQGRGFSRLAPALQEFQNITDFELSHIMKAISNSNLTVWVKPGPDNAATDIFEGHAGSPASQFGENPTPSESAENVDVVDFNELPEARFRKPGTTAVMKLNKGEELKEFASKTPSDSFDSFVNSVTSHLSSALSIPMEVLLMKFNSNYSASRAALIMFWRVAQIWREEMAADYLNPVYEMWLSGEIAAGRIEAPGWSDPRIRRAWLNNRWQGSPMPNIDPQKTATATKLNAEMGLTTLAAEARTLNGSSAEANRARQAEEFSQITPSPFVQKGNR